MLEARILRIIAIALLSVSVPFACAQKASFGPKLTLAIRTERPSYRMSDGLHLELEFVNVGSGPMLLYREMGAGVGRTNLRVFDEHGKEVTANFIADELPPPPPPYSKEGFVEIKRDESYRTQLTDSFKDIVNRSGSYELVVEYTSTISDRWARKYLSLPMDRLWTREKGTIVSNRIRIKVTD